MTTLDVNARIRTALATEIDKQAFGQDFGFDCTLAFAPVPTGGTMIMYQLLFTMRSPLLGQPPIPHIVRLAHPQPTPEMVEKAVTDALKILRDRGAEALKAGVVAPPAPGRQPAHRLN